MLSDEVQKGLKTLQREFTELVGAFSKMALHTQDLTKSVQILATELAILKNKMEEKNGNSTDETRIEGSGKEEG